MRVLIAAMLAACHHGQAPPPPPPTCAEAAEHVRALLGREDAGAREIQRVFQVRCQDDRWPGDVRSCVVSTQSFKDPKHCKARLTIAQRSHLDADLQEAAAAVRARQLPPPCVQYREIVAKVASCNRIPQDMRDAMKQGLEALEKNWTDLDNPQRYRSISDSCKAIADEVRQTVTALGCPP